MSTITSLFSLEGKIALVTGASRGLGQSMAIAMAEAGANVAALSTVAENSAETVKEIEKTGRGAIALDCDVTKKEQIYSAIQKTLDRYGKIDILINNAGTIRRAPAVNYSDEDWELVMETNLNSVFRFCREVGKLMVERKSGKIINIASLLSFSGGITVPAYAASKGGVAQLTKALANEWAKHNVQINSIAPGYFRTDNTRALQDDPVRNEQIKNRIPAGQWGNPDDMKGAVIFLASPASDYVNGHVMLVDGGWMAR